MRWKSHFSFLRCFGSSICWVDPSKITLLYWPIRVKIVWISTADKFCASSIIRIVFSKLRPRKNAIGTISIFTRRSPTAGWYELCLEIDSRLSNRPPTNGWYFSSIEPGRNPISSPICCGFRAYIILSKRFSFLSCKAVARVQNVFPVPAFPSQKIIARSLVEIRRANSCCSSLFLKLTP